MGLDATLIPSTSELRVPVSIPANFKYNEEEQEVEVEEASDGDSPSGDKDVDGGNSGDGAGNAGGVTTEDDIEDTTNHDPAI